MLNQLIDLWKDIDNDIAWDLIKSWEEKLLVDNLGHSIWLKRPIAEYLVEKHIDSVLKNMWILNYWVREKWEKEYKYEKIATFDFNQSDYEYFVLNCIHNWKWSEIVRHINDFIVHEKTYDKNPTIYNVTCTLDWTPIFDVKFIEEMMLELIKFDLIWDNSYWTIYLNEFQKHYHWLISPEIAFNLIDMWWSNIDDVVKNLSLFKPNKQLVYKLLELWYWEKINAESISWFEWEEYKEITHQLIDCWVKL